MRVSYKNANYHTEYSQSAGKSPPNAPNFDCVLPYPQRQEETAKSLHIEGAVRRSVETGDRGRGSDTRAAINRRTVYGAFRGAIQSGDKFSKSSERL